MRKLASGTLEFDLAGGEKARVGALPNSWTVVGLSFFAHVHIR